MNQRKRRDFEMKFYEGLLHKTPNFIQVLSCLGDIYTQKGFYKEGLDVDRRLVELKPCDPLVHYNLACSLSLIGDIEEAFRELKRAIEFGFGDFPYILVDPDLENIRADVRFKEFLQEIEQVDNAV